MLARCSGRGSLAVSTGNAARLYIGARRAASTQGNGESLGAIPDLRKELGKNDVKWLLPSYVDMHGVSKSKVVPIAHLDNMMGGSEMYTGAALEGVPQDMSEPEICSVPDPASCIVLPWAQDTAWFASDLSISGPGGIGADELQPFEPCSRRVLGRVLAKASSMGFVVDMGTEAEFFVLKDTPEGGFEPLNFERPALAKPAYDVARVMDNMGWLGELVDMMNQLGWDVYSFDHEDGVGQFGVHTLPHSDNLASHVFICIHQYVIILYQTRVRQHDASIRQRTVVRAGSLVRRG
jgi:glutamine synthetase